GVIPRRSAVRPKCNSSERGRKIRISSSSTPDHIVHPESLVGTGTAAGGGSEEQPNLSAAGRPTQEALSSVAVTTGPRVLVRSAAVKRRTGGRPSGQRAGGRCRRGRFSRRAKARGVRPVLAFQESGALARGR